MPYLLLELELGLPGTIHGSVGLPAPSSRSQLSQSLSCPHLACQSSQAPQPYDQMEVELAWTGPPQRWVPARLKQQAIVLMVLSHYLLSLLTELNLSKQKSFRDHCLGQNPLLCLAKARTTLSCHQLASLALGHWPLAMGQAPGHATEPSSLGMEEPYNTLIGLGRLRGNLDTVEMMTPSLDREDIPVFLWS